MRAVLLAAVAVLAAVAPALGADDSIEPDRPDTTNSANTVGRGRVHVESGVFYGRTHRAPMGDDRDRRDDSRFAVETTIRVGVVDSLELRLEAEPYVRLLGFEEASDHGDFKLAAKWRFFEPSEGTAWPALALLPFVKLPVSEEPIGSGKTDFGAVLAASFDLPWRLGLDVNAGIAGIGQNRPGGYLVQGIASASLSREIIEGVGVFGEVFYNSREQWGASDRVGVDAGLSWKATKTVALDVAAGTFVHGFGPDWMVRAGVSVRFGR